jgi:hypothetical protein
VRGLSDSFLESKDIRGRRGTCIIFVGIFAMLGKQPCFFIDFGGAFRCETAINAAILHPFRSVQNLLILPLEPINVHLTN